MKIKYYFFLFWSFFSYSQVQNGTWSVNPNPFNEDEEIEVKVSGINASNWGVEDVYLWTWYFDSNDVEVKPNFVPPPPSHEDYINNMQTPENLIIQNNNAQRQIDNLDAFYGEFQLPILIAILYFLFQLPIFKKNIKKILKVTV